MGAIRSEKEICPKCGTRTSDYGGTWSCNNPHCDMNCSYSIGISGMKSQPIWWKEDVIMKLDGNKWCAHREDFTNLQECNAGFGDTPQEAYEELKLTETK
jgi:hypothetical protein